MGRGGAESIVIVLCLSYTRRLCLYDQAHANLTLNRSKERLSKFEGTV